jgi:hypothetical protein
MATQDVLINFRVNDEELVTAQEQLAKAGKIDSKMLDQFNLKLKAGTQDTKGLIAEFKRVATTATQLGKSVENAFGQGVQDALDEAGVSAEEFAAALQQANQPAVSFRTRMRELREQLAQLKLEGKDNTEEFRRLRDEAGAMADAVADANAEVANVASDTRNVDNLVGSIGAAAGAFSAVQGAAALFGDESEDLQKALLKVNAAMAISTGIQQVLNATQKEGALTKLADVVATNAQVAVQKLYTLATGKSTAATVAFKVALAATGIGVAVVAVLALVSALDDQSDSLEEVNKRIDDYNTALDSSISLLERQTNLAVARANLLGKAESDLQRIQVQGLVVQYNLLTATLDRLKAERDAVDATSAQWFALNDAIEDNIDRRAKLANQIEILNLQGQKAVKDEAETAAKDAKERRDKALKDARDARIRELQDVVFFIERQLLSVEAGTQAELELRKKLALAKRDVELAQEGVTQEQANLIRAQAIKERQDLDEAYFRSLRDKELQAAIDGNAAALENIRLSYAERLDLQIQQIQLAAQQEVNAAEGNAEKIAAINAKRDADISRARNAEIERGLAVTLATEQRNAAAISRIQERIVSDANRSVDERVAALDKITEASLRGLYAQLQANEQLEQSDEDYLNKRRAIIDEITQVEQAAADRREDIYKEEAEKREEALRQAAQVALEIAGQVADFFANLSALTSERENQQIEAQRTQLEALIEAGAISQKEAEKRAKEIEILEKKAKQAQAEREKREAIFRAVLAIPEAYLQGLTTGGPILGAIYAGLAAAQAAIIAARPVPKFFRGKRDSYEGRGMVADMGAELVERGGRMYLYTKPTETYLSRTDKVYTAAETRRMLHNEKAAVTVQHGQPVERIDYDRLAKAIPASNFSVNIDKDFIEESVANGLAKNRYYDKWYSL